jgi:signal transduction histidine kinase
MTAPAPTELFNLVWNDAALLMLQLDPAGLIQKANRFAIGYIGENTEGKPLTGLIVDFTRQLDPKHIDEWPKEPQWINFHVPSGSPVTFRVSFLSQKDGILVVGSPDIAGLEKLQSQVLHLNHDLSDLSRQLQKSNAELKTLDALKNRFLGMAAHDLRTPLGAVSSFTEFLRDEAGPSLSDEHNEFIEIILASSKRMQQLIEDFLDVSMIESGQLSLSRKPATAGAIVAGVRSMIDLVARAKGVVLEANLEEAGLMLEVDESKIGQVLINLIRNAIEYSNAGGRIRISTRQEGSNLVFAVQDEAGGIPEEQCKQIFAPFERAETLKTGGERSVGLGLAIAKKIVTAHGGTLRVESEWGIGSTFSFSLPITIQTL